MWRVVVMVVVVATVGRCKHIDDRNKLQSLLPEPSDTPTSTTDPLDPLLSNNHTSVSKSTGIEDPIDFNTSEGEHQNGTAESEPAMSTTPKPSKDKDKKWSVPKKGVNYKPSVVPKKGVHYGSSVVGKKGADPELSTPSVSPRKGAEPESLIPSVSARKGAEPESESPEQSISARKGVEIDVPMPELVSKNFSRTSEIITDTSLENPGLSEEDMNEKGKTYSIPSPQRINPSNEHKDNPMNEVTSNYEDMLDYTSTIPMEMIANGSSNKTVDQGDQTTVTSESQNTTSNIHYKPVAAMDDLDIYAADDSDSVNYVAVLLGLILILSFVILVVVGYRKFKDVWMRRHYASVDFLVEGMYED